MKAQNINGKILTAPQVLSSSMYLGIVSVMLISILSTYFSTLPFFENIGLSSLTIAILVGVVIGNCPINRAMQRIATGVDFSKSVLLKLGVILFGLRITFEQIAQLGWYGVFVDVVVVTSVLLVAYLLGTKLFNLDYQTSILIGAGSAICGAAAVLATEPVVKAQAHKVSIAVATVVLFGTTGMFLYPALYPYLGLTEHVFGIYIGATVHEVAQVVAAGTAVNSEVANAAVIEKMVRVMLLAPTLLFLSWVLARKTNAIEEIGSNDKPKLIIPWFAVLFIVVSGINSLQIIPSGFHQGLLTIDNYLLCMAMAALGLRTHLTPIFNVGFKPVLLAACLFFMLVAGGYSLSYLSG
ncbi:YeiH family protein [Alteromonas macleodii]|uniref:YeiH family protein n=1 Tax=Alteromonas macleodii TaxID=28108 RepID=UPI0036571A8C